MGNTKPRGKFAAITAVVLAALIVIVIAIPLLGLVKSGDPSGSLQIPSPTDSATPTPTPTSEACSASWVIEEADNTNNRWFLEGIASIKDATTNEEATAAAYDWQEKVRTDPDLLAGAAKVFLQRDVDRNSLVNSEGCATEAAVDLDMEIGIALATAKVTPDDVDPNAFNTGVQDGIVIGDASGGIGGDLSAVQVTLSDGRVIWIMARCGNLATQGPPPLPPGITDNPERCAYNPQLPPDSPDCVPPVTPECPEGTNGTWPVCKDSPSNDPGPSGNAPIGQGPNEDPGPGEYVPAPEMEQPPEAPRVDPPAPAPQPAAPGPSAPAPSPDPAPAPAPEPAAPAPSEAPDTCPIPPGMTSC